MPEEKTITDAALRVYKLVEEYSENVPNVFLDPTPFDEVGAKVAPMILAYQGKEIVSFATGLTNTRYMYEQLEKNNVGDLGSFGNTILISERSLTEILKERFGKVGYR
ncbi:hypothetical protein [Psychromonas sp. KJ10-2]|uniref:hypothetical protein n=1 Tax=Psychromonas sp. KJ10-2 TaxID=3391822 RepID=UPI0039B484AC